MTLDPESINRLIADRRSVYQAQYSGERVDDSIVKQMLENANWAPTHKLTEPWRFTVFNGDGIAKLAEFQSSLYRRVATANGAYKEDSFQKLLVKPALSSHIIAVGMVRDPRKSLPEIEEIGAVFCAVQNMYLTACAYGVGCYLSTGGITFYEEAKPFFGLGVDDKLLGFMHVGMPKGALPPGKRTPVDQKVKWVA
ncbi:MAG TPA: nitroreductase [Chryseolinea sp.]|nr:nitroreductase [Chryseolinea sp.]